MVQINKTLEREKDLTIISVSGLFSIDQIIAVVDQYYASEITQNLIYDLSRADMSSLKAHDFKRIISHARQYMHLRKGGKTAFVLGSDLDFGLARMYETYSELKNHPIPQAVFKSLDQAMHWLEK